jgi:class 3 adenylate cyclase/tetratricopeptide (TPR) repeat protein
VEPGTATGDEALPSGRFQPRVMVMFCDLVGSTELSGRHDPERYGLLVERFVAHVRDTLEQRYGGEVVGVRGDGLLVLFGAPKAHGDDAERAVRAALESVERVKALSAQTQREVGESLAIRIAIHRGPIYRDLDEVYGLIANVAARLEGLAPPNGVAISDEVQRLVGQKFETVSLGAHLVKGVDEPLHAHQVLGERTGAPGSVRAGAPFVNRRAEWDLLQSLWAEVGPGRARTAAAVLLRGEAGVGKSCLASRLTETTRDRQAVVVELAGSAFFQDEGLRPVRRFIEHAAGIERQHEGPERLRRLRRELHRRGLDPESLIPLVAPILGIEPDAGYVAVPLDTRKLSKAVSEAAHHYLCACLGTGPSVLVVEDLQWLDETTRALIERIAGSDALCMVLMTARPGTEPFAGVLIVELEPFSETDSARLIEALSTEAPLRSEVRDALIARGDGIPLYIRELMSSVEQGIPSSPQDPTLAATGAVPDILYDVLAARLRSPDDIIPVAGAAAVIGRDVELHLLQTVVGRSAQEINRALETLCQQDVLELRDSSRGYYRFRHELLREVAYELQPPSQRRVVHGRVADALSSGSSEGDVVDWSGAASHFEKAGRAGSAVQAYERAALTGLRRGSFREARGHLSRAIELLTANVPHDPPRDLYEVNLRLRRGYLAVSEEGHSSPSAATDYQRCLELAQADPTGDEWFRVVIVLWTYHVIRGEIDEAHRISDLTYQSLDRRGWYGSYNLASFGILECWAGDFRAARDLLHAFEAIRAPQDDQRFRAEWLNPDDPVNGVFVVSAVVEFLTGDDIAAVARFTEALDGTHDMDFPEGPYTLAHALTHDAWMRMELAQFGEAEEDLTRLSELAARHGFDSWGMVAVMQQTVLSALRAEHGGTATVEEFAQRASDIDAMIEIWKQFDTRYFLTYYLTVAGVIHGWGGDTHTARARLEESLRLGDETTMRFYQAETLRHLANLELHPKGKEEGLREALDLARRQHGPLFELRAALDLVELRGVAARGSLETAVGRMRTTSSYPELARARTTLNALG